MSAVDETPFILINEFLIPDLNVEKYLSNIEIDKLLNTPSNSNLNIVSPDKTIEGNDLYIGKKVTGKYHSDVEDGVYQGKNQNYFDMYVIESNIIKNIFYLNNYKTFDNISIVIHQKYNGILLPKDFILDFSSIVISQNPIRIFDKNNNEYEIKLSGTGEILEVKEKNWLHFLNWIILSFLFFILLYFILAAIEK
jgi:hypothetical protein